MGKQIKLSPLQQLGFEDDGTVTSAGSPVASTDPFGFETPNDSRSPESQATPSEQYTPGYVAGTSLQDHIAENQNGWDQFANMLEQTGISALTGTVESAAYMLDLKQHLDWFKGEEENYTNWVSDLMKQAREANKDAFPIHLSRENEGFNPGSPEWWAHHGGDTIGTVIGLMVPALGVAKLGKLAGLGKMGQAVSATVASRAAESTMEANQVYTESYKALLDQGVSDEQAKLRAGAAATKAWNTNWLFAIQDLGQFRAITRGLEKAAKGSIGKSIAEFLGTTASESAEEVGQYVTSEEAKRIAMETDVDFFGEGLSKRISDYTNEDAFKTSALLGAFGGGVFNIAGNVADTIKDPNPDSPIMRAKAKMQELVKTGLGQTRAKQVNDMGSAQKWTDTAHNARLIEAYRGGQHRYLPELEEGQRLEGVSTEDKKNIDGYISDVKEVMDKEAKLKAINMPPEERWAIIENVLDQKQNNRIIQSLDAEIEKTKQEVLRQGELDVQVQELKNIQIQLEGYRQLAAKQPQYAHKVAALQAAFNNASAAINPNPIPGVMEAALKTTKDDELFQKSFQSVASKEKKLLLEQEAVQLSDPKMRQQKIEAKKLQDRIAATTAILNNKESNKEQILAAIESAPTPELKAAAQSMYAKMQSAGNIANREVLDNMMGSPLPVETVPSPVEQGAPSPVEMPVSPVDQIPPYEDTVAPNEAAPMPEDFSAYEEPVPSDINFAGLSMGESQWAGLTTEQAKKAMDGIDLEAAKPVKPTSTKKEDDIKVQENIERVGAPGWMAERTPVKDNTAKRKEIENKRKEELDKVEKEEELKQTNHIVEGTDISQQSLEGYVRHKLRSEQGVDYGLQRVIEGKDNLSIGEGNRYKGKPDYVFNLPPKARTAQLTRSDGKESSTIIKDDIPLTLEERYAINEAWELPTKERHLELTRIGVEIAKRLQSERTTQTEQPRKVDIEAKREAINAKYNKQLATIETGWEPAIYTDNTKMKDDPKAKVRVTEHFATDPVSGQLIKNTPAIEVGAKVTLKIENDFPVTLTPGFKPTPGVNDVINVYADGIRLPIEQLANPDNKRYANDPKTIAALKKLRAKVIAAGGIFRTTILRKTRGTPRITNIPKSITIFRTDYVQNSEGIWTMQQTPYHIPLGFIDQNGNVDSARAEQMAGMSFEDGESIKAINDKTKKSELIKLKGAIVAFRRAPDGSMSFSPVERRKLDASESGWVLDNLPTLIATRDWQKLEHFVYMPRHNTHVYNTKGGTQKTSLLEDRVDRIHIVLTSSKTSDLVIPFTSEGKRFWFIVADKALPAMMSNQPFPFKVMDENGMKSRPDTVQLDHKVVKARLTALMQEQYFNVSKESLNSEVPYQDPRHPDALYRNGYLQYLLEHDVLSTNLAGANTLGYGDDSSYSFFESALYLDPDPQEADVTLKGTLPETIKEPKPVIPPAPAEPATKPKTIKEILEAVRGPKAKPASGSGYKRLTAKEVDYIKDTIGAEFIQVVKGVDSFVGKAGVEAFGEYYDAMITLATQAPEGTGYHEKGHFVMDPNNGLITIEEREKILDEASKVYGIARSPITTETVKEELSEEEMISTLDPELVALNQALIEEIPLELDNNEPVLIEELKDIPVAEQEPTVTEEQITGYFDAYTEYWQRRYPAETKYTGPRKKEEVQTLLRTVLTSLDQTYVEERVTGQQLNYRKLPSAGDPVALTTRFLKNIQKNIQHSTPLDKPFAFKDATDKENEVLNRFYAQLKAELEDFSAKTGKAVPKVIPNSRLVEKFSHFLNTNYQVQTYSTPPSKSPYGLHNIIKQQVPIVGSEVFVSDGLHFPNIASGHNKKLGDTDVVSNTLGWFIDTNIDGDTFMYEFQSDIIPEVQEGDFSFTVKKAVDPKNKAFTVSISGSGLVIKPNEKSKEEILTSLKDLINTQIRLSVNVQVNKKIEGERYFRGDLGDYKNARQAYNSQVGIEVDSAAVPDYMILAQFLRAKSYPGREVLPHLQSLLNELFIVENVPIKERIEGLKPLIGPSAYKALMDYLKAYAYTSNTLDSVTLDNVNLDRKKIRESLSRAVDGISILNTRYRRNKNAPKLFSSKTTLSLYFAEQRKAMSKKIQRARGAQRKALATKSKALIRKDIYTYYAARRKAITEYYYNLYSTLIPTINEKLEAFATHVDSLVNKDHSDVATEKSLDLNLDEEYKHWYKVMFEKFIKIALMKAKARGDTHVYLPTYQSMKSIEGSGTTGRIYATPQELQLSDKIESVGPFYSALSKVKGIKINGLRTPEWSTKPLLSVDISQYGEKELERFKPTSPSYNQTQSGDYQLEEKIMEDFEKYKLANGRYVPEVVAAKGFFARLWQTIKGLLGFRTPIENILRKLDTARLTPDQRSAIKENRAGEPNPAKAKKLPGFTGIDTQYEAVEMFSSEIMRLTQIASREEGVKVGDLLTTPKFLEDRIEEVKKNLEADLNSILQIPEAQRGVDSSYRLINYLSMGLKSNLPIPLEYQSLLGDFEDPANAAGYPVDGFKSKVIKNLARFGFQIGVSPIEPDDEQAKTEAYSNETEHLYNVEHTLRDPFDGLSQRIKLFLSTIPEPETDSEGNYTGKPKTTRYGTPQYINVQRVNSSLTMKLRDSVNPIATLQELAETDDIAAIVYEALIYEKNKGNNALFNEFATKFNLDGYYKKDSVIEAKTRARTDKDPIDMLDPDSTVITEYTAKTMDSDQGSADRTVFNRWREVAINKKLTDTSGEVNLAKAKTLNTQFSEFRNELLLSEARKQKPYDEVLNKFTGFLRQLGVTLPQELYAKWNSEENINFKYKNLTSLIVGTEASTLQHLLKEMTGGKDPYDNVNNVIGNLAKQSAPFLENDHGTGYLNSNGDIEYPVNYPSVITEIFKYAKHDRQGFTDFFRSDPALKPNKFLNALRTDSSNKINVFFSATIRNNDNNHKSFEDRGRNDSIIMRMVNFFNNANSDKTSQIGLFFVGTSADKTKQILVSLPKYHGEAARQNLFSVFTQIMDSEIIRINRLKIEQPANGASPIPSDITEMRKGAKFLHIDELNSIPELLARVTEGEITPEEMLKAREKAEAIIYKHIDKLLDNYKNYLVQNGLATRETRKDGKEIFAPTSKIPRVLFRATPTDPHVFLEEFFYNDTLWRLSMSQLLMGDFSQYKSTNDYFKRAYQLVTPGLKGYYPQKTNLTVAVYPKQMKRLNDEELANIAKHSDPEIAARYKDINKTDAQSLATIGAYRTLTDALGQWSSEQELIYNIAWKHNKTIRKALSESQTTPEGEPISEDYAEYLKAVAAETTLAALKPFRYADRAITLQDGTTMIIKEQFKDSIAALTPELSAVHRGYAQLSKYMWDNTIDIMSAEDTVKVGQYGILDMSQPAAEWQKRKVDASTFRFPQLIPDTKKQQVSGSQIHKLILGDINPTTNYHVNGKTISGAQVIKEVNENWVDKINLSADELRTALGVGEDFMLSDKPKTRNDQLYKLKVILQQEILGRDLSDNYLDVIEIVRRAGDKIDFTIPISFPAVGAKFQSVLTNLWKKKVLRQKSTGYVSVNLADFGVGHSDELKFMATDPTTKETYTEIGLPIDFFSQIGLKYGENVAPNGTILWDSEKLTEEQRAALQFILYRIPTSNKSSMLPVRVAKVLPRHMNNMVIIPGELTVQQGLDFDVDKSQLIKRVLTKPTKENKRIKVDRDHPDTKIFDLYWGILTNKAHTKAMLTPLATPRLEAIYKKYVEAGIITSDETYPMYTIMADVEAEIRNKDGKSEIGIASRFNTGHSLLQTIQKWVSSNTRINIDNGFTEVGGSVDSNGTLISENFGETQQAALDSAKTPLLAYFNVVRGTMAAFETLVGFGIPLETVTDFFMQPIIREWTRYYDQEGQNPTRATRRLYTENPVLLRMGDVPITSAKLKQHLKGPADPAWDASVMNEFLHVMAIAQQMSRVNNVLSIDTASDFSSPEILIDLKGQVAHVTNPQALVTLDKRVFDLTTAPPEAKRIAAFYQHGVEDALQYINQFFPNASYPYQYTADYLRTVTSPLDVEGNPISVGALDTDSRKALSQYLNYHMLQENAAMSRQMLAVHPGGINADFHNRWDLFDPNRSIWTYITNSIRENPLLEKNPLIKSLESTKTSKDRVVIVGPRNTDSKINKSEITQGWEELFESDKLATRILAHDLVRYSVITSGFKFGKRSMADLIPVSYWISSGIAQTWSNTMDFIDSWNIDKEAVVTGFIRHNFKEIERFPEFYGKFGRKGFKSNRILSVEVVPNTKHIKAFKIDASSYGEGTPPRFVRLFDELLQDYRLYELSPQNKTDYREVQALGERGALVEPTTTGRDASRHPKNKNESVPDPWFEPKKIDATFNLFTNELSENANQYTQFFLPSKINEPKEVLEKLRDTLADTDSKANIDTLLRNIDKINTRIIIGEIKTQVSNPDDVIAGQLQLTRDPMNGTSSTIVINKDVNFSSLNTIARVLLHELNHAYTVGVIQAPYTDLQKDFVRTTNRLRNEAIKKHGGKVVQGLEDDYEFVAEMGSRPGFRKFIQGQGLFDRWIRGLRKLFGIPDKFDTYLKQLYEVLDTATAGDLVYDTTLGKLSFDIRMKEEEVKAKKRLTDLERILQTLNSRMARYKSLGNRNEVNRLSVTIDEIEKLAVISTEQAIVKYLAEVSKEVNTLKNTTLLMQTAPERLVPEILYNMREQLKSYTVLGSISNEIRRHPTKYIAPGGEKDLLFKNLDTLLSDVSRLEDSTRKLAVHRFASLIVETLKDPDLTLDTVMDQLEIADRDVNVINRWVQTGMETDDVAIQTVASMIKKNADNAYRKIQDDLYQSTPTDAETVYVRYEDNKNVEGKHPVPHGLLFRKIGFEKALEAYEKWRGKSNSSFRDKFAPIIDEKATEAEDSTGIYLIDPLSPEGKRIRNISESSPDYPLRQFYETFVMGYIKSQENIPAFGMRPGLRIPSIGHTVLEGILKKSGLDKFTALKEAALNSIRKRYDEVDLQAQDQAGRPQEFIPTRFIARQDGVDGRLSKKEVSLDLATTLPVFIHEMYNRKGLEKMQADLELGKLVMSERKVMKTRRVKGAGLGPALSSAREGIVMESGEYETIPGGESNSYQAFDSLLRRFLYGQYKKDEGNVTIGKLKLSGTKMVDTFLKITGFRLLVGNIAVPLTNAAVGETTFIKEVVGGNLINLRDYIAGKSLFKKAGMAAIADLGQRIKKTKYGRIYSYFNIADTRAGIGDLGVSTSYFKTIWEKVSRTGNGMVEFYLASTALGATFNRFKATNSKGEPASLYDAIEVNSSGKLVLSEGYTYKGKKSISGDDITEIKEYALRVNQLMNGVYNTMDKPALNEFIVGRLLGFMRNWLKAGFDARWRTRFKDRRLGGVQNEGHYISALVAFNAYFTEQGAGQGLIDSLRLMFWKGYRDPKLLLLPEEHQLSEQAQQDIIGLRQANIRKTLFEVYSILALGLLLAFGWDDEEEDSYMKYIAARVQRELLPYLSPSTAMDILRSPTVALNTIETLSKINKDIFAAAHAGIMGEEIPTYLRGPKKGEVKIAADLKVLLGLGFTYQFEDVETKTRIIRTGFK